MSYLIDANVLIRAYAPLDPQHPRYEELSRQKVEALRAIEKLREQGETLYHTKEVLADVRKGVQHSAEKQGLALTPDQADKLVKAIEKEKDVKSLERQLEKQLEGKSQAEQEKIKAAQHKAEERALEKANRTIEKAKEQATTQKEKRALEHAKEDTVHVAKAETHNLKVLTSNDKDFLLHKDIEVKHTRAVALDLKPELVKSYDGNNIKNPPREYYDNTKTYKVELTSGKTAYLNIKGLERGDKERDILYHPDVIKKLERQGGDPNKPVNIEIKNPPNGLTPPGGKLQPSEPSPDKPPKLGGAKSLSETVSPSKIAEAGANAVKKTAQIGVNIGEKTLKTATQAAATASEKTLKTAATIATASVKAAEKVTQVVASVTPVTKAVATAVTAPIKLTTEAVKAVKQTAEVTSTIARGIKEELQSKNHTHRFDVRIGDKKYDAAIKAESREAAEVKLKELLNNKEFVKELKAQKPSQQIAVKAEKIENKETRTQIPPPPKQEPTQER